MTGYTDTIRRWATDTRRAGEIQEADGIGEVGLEAGDVGRRLAVRFALKMESDRVTDARYQVFGCGFSMAACAVAADLAVGYTVDDLESIDARQLDRILEGLPADRAYCADLAVEALRAAAASVRRHRQPVQASVPERESRAPRLTASHPVYSALLATPPPGGISAEDRHLFACLLTVAAEESSDPAGVLGLVASDLDSIRDILFPGFDLSGLAGPKRTTSQPPPEINRDVLAVLHSYLPLKAAPRQLRLSVWLAYIIAARAMQAGHLWVAMGLFERPELTAAIRRHLPAMADANHANMRWKRFLYKQVCDRSGGTMCKAPNCGVCSDYALCFADS